MLWTDKIKKLVDMYVIILALFKDKRYNIETESGFFKLFHNCFNTRRDMKWHQKFFKIVNKHRKSGKIPSFRDILVEIFNETNQVEKSFASKALHMLNEDSIIIDKRIIEKLNIKDKTKNVKDPIKKINFSCDIYDDITREVNNIKNSKDGKRIIKEFKKAYPNIKISDTKIIDFYLWSE